MKKIAVIGRGTVGVTAVAHYLRWTNCEIDWYYDPEIKPAAVGEGTTLTLPDLLNNALKFDTVDLHNIEGTPKLGIWKDGWGKTGKEFIHTFPVGNYGIHFNAVIFQEYMFNKLKNDPRVNLIEKNVFPYDVDADHIMSCTGSPKTFGQDKFNKRDGIPVNAAFVSQCSWDYQRFDCTMTHAKKHGWVFGIPLKHRVAIGYLYNSDITSEETIKEEVNEILHEMGLFPYLQRGIKFENYSRKINFEDNGRIVHNGNSSFFLEPLEATSTSFASDIIKMSSSIILGEKPLSHNSLVEELENEYNSYIDSTEDMICLHYMAGSIYKSEFWDYAQEKSTKRIEKSFKNKSEFARITAAAYDKNYDKFQYWPDHVGTWQIRSYRDNIDALEIASEIKELINKYN